LFVLVGVAFFAGGNLSPGVREDRSNRSGLVAFRIIRLLDGFLLSFFSRAPRGVFLCFVFD
jgi:hypothetical protein